jgi:hypothetical protein
VSCAVLERVGGEVLQLDPDAAAGLLHGRLDAGLVEQRARGHHLAPGEDGGALHLHEVPFGDGGHDLLADVVE